MATAGLLLVIGWLAGCIDDGSVDGRETSAVLSVPIWSPGDAWNYVKTGGHHQNWTVEALEPRNGYDTYRVRIQSQGPGYRTLNTTMWVDVSTLGVVELGTVEEGRDEWNTVIDPPGKQLFPMHNRTYTSTWQNPLETTNRTTHVTVDLRLRPIQVPAGTIDAVRVDSREEETGAVAPAWYGPHVGNYVRIGAYEPFELVSWDWNG